MLLVLVCLSLAAAQINITLGGDYWKGLDVPPGSLVGFVDLHCHPLNGDGGFGGHLYAGHLSGPIEQALSECSSDHGKGLLGKGSFSISPEVAFSFFFFRASHCVRVDVA